MKQSLMIVAFSAVGLSVGCSNSSAGGTTTESPPSERNNDAGDSATPTIPSRATIWSVASGGNGHGYLLVTVKSVITWSDAKAAAIGMGGHLATITSAAENDFVFSLASGVATAWAPDVPYDQSQGPWLGASATGSVWSWVTGEPWSYTNWGSGQPSGMFMGTIEDKLEFNSFGTVQPASTWNDVPNAGFENGPTAYVVEFE
jgi:hypothetical protein